MSPERATAGGAFGRLRRGAALAAGLGILGMTLLGAADVAGRFALGRPLLGQVEVARILLVYVAFLGLAEAERAGEHVRLRLLDPLLSGRARAARDRGLRLLALATAALATVASARVGADSFSAGARMIAPIPLPAWLVDLGVTLGFLLFTAELARGALRRGAGWSR